MRRARRMLRRGILLLVLAGATWFAIASRESRREWLSAIRPAPLAVDNCRPMLDDSAVAFVHLHRELDQAVKRGNLSRVREDSEALARHLGPVDPIAAAAALHLAEATDTITARQRFERMDHLLRDPARPRGSDPDQPNVIVAPAVN